MALDEVNRKGGIQGRPVRLITLTTMASCRDGIAQRVRNLVTLQSRTLAWSTRTRPSTR